jgi:acyl phosphate:glycerol-3-phosphate acyltransferase
LLIIFRHRTNIMRLLRGQEPKVGTKKAPTDET